MYDFVVVVVTKVDVLLLQDMLKATPAPHPDHEPLVDAHNFIKDLADYINERKHEADNTNDLNEVQAKWTGFPGSLAQNPRRRLLKEGPVMISKDKSHLWLFTDIAVITKEAKKGIFPYKQMVNLKTTTVQTEDALKFRIVSMEGVLKVALATPQEKEAWDKVFEETLKAAHELMLRGLFVDEVYCYF